MRKRYKMRAKRDRAWEKMEERQSKNKAHVGISLIVAMFFIMGIMSMCTPDDADARSRSSSRPSSSKSRSYSKPAPKKTVVRKAAPRKKLFAKHQ